MKTSHLLFVTVAVVTLTGMVATDVLLRREHNKIDWHDPYQGFERRTLPPAQHVVVQGAPIAEIVVQKSTGAQALVHPGYSVDTRFAVRNDTLYVTFRPQDRRLDSGDRPEPRNDVYWPLEAGLVLRLPDLQSLRVTNGRVTLEGLVSNQLTVQVQNTRLRTDRLAVAESFNLTAEQNSFAVLGADQYQSLQMIVRDSSGLRLNYTQAQSLTSNLSPKAEVQLRGRALQWLKR